MAGPAKFFSERYSVDLRDGKVFDRPLTPELRGWIGVTMAIHNQPIKRGEDPQSVSSGGSDVVTETLRLLVRHIGRSPSESASNEGWRPAIALVHGGSPEQVFDVVELMHHLLPPECRRLFAVQINHVFETGGLAWRLSGGEIARSDVSTADDMSHRPPR